MDKFFESEKSLKMMNLFVSTSLPDSKIEYCNEFWQAENCWSKHECPFFQPKDTNET